MKVQMVENGTIQKAMYAMRMDSDTSKSAGNQSFFGGLILEIGLCHFIRGPGRLLAVDDEILSWMNLPADSSAGHRGDDPGTHSAQKSFPSKLAFNDSSGVEKAFGRANLLVLCETPSLK
jgi:hypothetical protein